MTVRRSREVVSPRIRAVAASIAALTSIGPALVFLFLAWYAYRFRCDDSCGFATNSSVWPIEFWVIAIPTLVIVALFIVFLATGRPVAAALSIVLAFVGFCFWWSLSAIMKGGTPPWPFPLEHTANGLIFLGIILMILGAGGAIALELRARRRGPIRRLRLLH